MKKIFAAVLLLSCLLPASCQSTSSIPLKDFVYIFCYLIFVAIFIYLIVWLCHKTATKAERNSGRKRRRQWLIIWGFSLLFVVVFALAALVKTNEKKKSEIEEEQIRTNARTAMTAIKSNKIGFNLKFPSETRSCRALW